MTTQSPSWRRFLMYLRPNHVASTSPVSSPRSAVVRSTRRRNVGATRIPRTCRRALADSPSGIRASSRTVLIPRLEPTRRSAVAPANPLAPIGVSSPTGPVPEAAGRPPLAAPGVAADPAARLVPTEPFPRVFALPHPEPATSLLGRDEVPVVGLPAVNHIDLQTAAPLTHSTAQGFRLGQICALTVVDRDELKARVQSLQRGQNGLRSVVADGKQTVVRIQNDRLSLLDLSTADRRVAHGFSDLKRLDRARGQCHDLGIGRGVPIGIHGQQGSETLSRIPSRHNADAPRRHLGRLTRRQNHI